MLAKISGVLILALAVLVTTGALAGGRASAVLLTSATSCDPSQVEWHMVGFNSAIGTNNGSAVCKLAFGLYNPNGYPNLQAPGAHQTLFGYDYDSNVAPGESSRTLTVAQYTDSSCYAQADFTATEPGSDLSVIYPNVLTGPNSGPQWNVLVQPAIIIGNTTCNDATPTPTNTATPTRTNTPTAIPTKVSTVTPTPTVPVVYFTPTPTRTPTVVAPTKTPTPKATVTPTAPGKTATPTAVGTKPRPSITPKPPNTGEGIGPAAGSGQSSGSSGTFFMLLMSTPVLVTAGASALVCARRRY